ncbi:MAG TPA: homocysteine S-methyltransferase [Pseudacidobacterium sp.]|jgi:homocysteine S-methyltransferase|nr:homocysteine S-methyltransferase [Pseudacidobacterium sp.]
MKPASQFDISGIRVLDGGMATELERRGCNISGPLWSAHVLADSPETIEAVHLSYLEAGADCILTASYQVSAKGYTELDQAGMPHPRRARIGGSQDDKPAKKYQEAAATALRQSIELALAAREKYHQLSARPIWIGVSLGPYGAALHNGAEYHGNYDLSFAELVQFHAERLAVVEKTQADFVAFETIPSIEEAEAIVEALHQQPTVHGWISFTCKDNQHIAHGEKLASCAEFLDKQKQIIAIGINCTHPKFIAPLIREIKQSTQKPIVVYPNSGEGWDAEHRRWTGTSNTAEFGHLAREWASAGAQIIGGCCRTSPEHVSAIHQALKS